MISKDCLKKQFCNRTVQTFFQKLLLPPFQKKYPVDFDDELKIGDVRYDDMTQITIKVQLF